MVLCENQFLHFLDSCVKVQFVLKEYDSSMLAHQGKGKRATQKVDTKDVLEGMSTHFVRLGGEKNKKGTYEASKHEKTHACTPARVNFKFSPISSFLPSPPFPPLLPFLYCLGMSNLSVYHVPVRYVQQVFIFSIGFHLF